MNFGKFAKYTYTTFTNDYGLGHSGGASGPVGPYLNRPATKVHPQKRNVFCSPTAFVSVYQCSCTVTKLYAFTSGFDYLGILGSFPCFIKLGSCARQEKIIQRALPPKQFQCQFGASAKFSTKCLRFNCRLKRKHQLGARETGAALALQLCWSYMQEPLTDYFSNQNTDCHC